MTIQTCQKLTAQTTMDWSPNGQSCDPYATGNRFDYMVTEPEPGATWRLDWWSLWDVDGRNFESFELMVEFINELENPQTNDSEFVESCKEQIENGVFTKYERRNKNDNRN